MEATLHRDTIHHEIGDEVSGWHPDSWLLKLLLLGIGCHNALADTRGESWV